MACAAMGRPGRLCEFFVVDLAVEVDTLSFVVSARTALVDRKGTKKANHHAARGRGTEGQKGSASRAVSLGADSSPWTADARELSPGPAGPRQSFGRDAVSL